ncbi:hypothetical protein [Streptomyces sp. H27-H5]|uniref:hypothetical protein n=1 Tax=Streptomyces sp. H27-H5 TaxID=2996460 RepID=UPI00226E2551|nr:hypothetical protein [Streptomyces sp. H27-H5]MCY0957487.1 hypothetical protein [Streptomyces sp. H27-H5]
MRKARRRLVELVCRSSAHSVAVRGSAGVRANSRATVEAARPVGWGSGRQSRWAEQRAAKTAGSSSDTSELRIRAGSNRRCSAVALTTVASVYGNACRPASKSSTG